MSFSAEMKDFLAAYKTGTAINASRTNDEYKSAATDALTKKTARDNDPDRLKLEDDQARANLAKTNAGIALTGEHIKNARTSRGYTEALTNRMNNPLAPGGAVGGSGLLPTEAGIGPVSPQGGAPNATVSPALQPRDDLYGYAKGGAIPDMADEDGDPEEAEDVAAAPAPAVGGTSDTTDISARRRGGQSGLPQGGFNGIVAPALINDATKAGYHYAHRLGLGGRGARGQQAAQALAQGAGALTPQEMEMARKAVDPEGKLTDSQRNMAALGSVYQFWANKGDPERAQKVAFQMLQHFRMATQRYAAIAAHAAEQGNMDLATKAAVKAYANVPDGRDMTLSLDPQNGRIVYHYTDENGKTISKGLATPQEFAAQAMGLARGGFDQAILSAAGQREAAEGGGKATSKGNGKGGGAGADVTLTKNIGGELDGELGKAQGMKGAKPEDDPMWGDLRDMATHIMQQNPKMTPREAIGAAQTLMFPKNAGDSAFKVDSKDGQNIVTFGDGKKAILDDDQFNAIMTSRAANLKNRNADEDKAKAEAAAGEERMGRYKDAGKRAIGAIGGLAQTASDVVGAPGRALAGAVDAIVPEDTKEEFKARAKSAVGAVGDAARDFGRRVADPNNIPAVAAYKGIRDADYGAIAGAIKHGVESALGALQRRANAGAVPTELDDRPSD